MTHTNATVAGRIDREVARDHFHLCNAPGRRSGKAQRS
jgi:hypothetical protein